MTGHLAYMVTGIGVAVGNHLWQSTVFALSAWLMALQLRRNMLVIGESLHRTHHRWNLVAGEIEQLAIAVQSRKVTDQRVALGCILRVGRIAVRQQCRFPRPRVNIADSV